MSHIQYSLVYLHIYAVYYLLYFTLKGSLAAMGACPIYQLLPAKHYVWVIMSGIDLSNLCFLGAAVHESSFGFGLLNSVLTHCIKNCHSSGSVF